MFYIKYFWHRSDIFIKYHLPLQVAVSPLQIQADYNQLSRQHVWFPLPVSLIKPPPQKSSIKGGNITYSKSKFGYFAFNVISFIHIDYRFSLINLINQCKNFLSNIESKQIQVAF